MTYPPVKFKESPVPGVNARLRKEVRIAPPESQKTEVGKYIATVIGATYVPVTKNVLLKSLRNPGSGTPRRAEVVDLAVKTVESLPNSYGFSSDRKWIWEMAFCEEDVVDAVMEAFSNLGIDSEALAREEMDTLMNYLQDAFDNSIYESLVEWLTESVQEYFAHFEEVEAASAMEGMGGPFNGQF